MQTHRTPGPKDQAAGLFSPFFNPQGRKAVQGRYFFYTVKAGASQVGGRHEVLPGREGERTMQRGAVRAMELPLTSCSRDPSSPVASIQPHTFHATPSPGPGRAVLTPAILHP